MRRTVMWRAIGVLVLTLVVSVAIQAQRVTGTVVEADGTNPARFVALLVVDSAGNAIARGQSTATGSFSIAVPSAGRYAVRALRVGFRPTVTPLVLVAADAPTTLQVHLTGQRVVLPTVTVRDRATCRSASASGDALIDTWDQARAALLGVAQNEPSSSLAFETVAWVVERDIWPDTGTTRHIDIPRRTAGAAFRSRPVTDLLREGFVRSAGDSVEFHGPDAFVLLDPEFATSYCFSLEPAPPTHPEWVGLGVYAARPAVGKVTIDGVLWLTRDGALVRFDYRYVGLDPVLDPAEPGGRVDFERLASGQWIVSRWTIRMPQLATQMQNIGFSSRQTPFKRLVRVVEKGALVSRVVFDGSEFLELGRESLTLTIRSSDGSAQPIAGTQVRLPAEGLSWVVDTSALLRIDHIRPGAHRFVVQTPLMRDVGAAPEAVDLGIFPDTGEMRGTLSVPSTSEVRRRLCAASDKDAVAIGRVARSLGALYVSRAADVADGAAPTVRRTAASVDSTGRWHLCGLPRGTSFVLWTEQNGAAATLARFRIPRSVDLAVVGSLSERVLAVTSALPTPTAADIGARLTVRVLAARDSSPLLDAEAVLDDSLLARPNARGELRFSGLADGLHVIAARHLGYLPSADSLELSHDQPRVVTVYLERLPQLLSEVMVRGRMVRVPLKYVDVLRRSASGWGTVFTREQIHSSYDLKSLLGTLPGVHVTDRNVLFRRCADNLDPAFPKKVQVYIDGVLVTAPKTQRNGLESDDPFLMSATADPVTAALRLVSPSDVEFMEVYRGVAQIPAEFVNDACAVIAIWTRAY